MSRRSRSLSVLVSGISLLALLSGAAVAQVAPAPSLLNFQGRLAKPDGTPVSNGTYTIRFRLYDSASAGAVLWEQNLTNIPVQNGVFAALLNVGSGFQNGATAATLFGGNLWLEIKIGADDPLSPRQQLVSVAYAQKANTVPDGAIGTSQLANGGVTGAKIASGTITSDKFALGTLNPFAWLVNGNTGISPTLNFLGTTDSQPLVFRTNNLERMRVLSSGQIGIGTSNTNPGALLTLRGGTNPIAMMLRSADDTDRWHLALNPDGQKFGLNFVESGVADFRLYLGPAGNVGIGTGAPAAKLDVNGTARVTGFQLPTGAAAGRVLTSDASGIATWQTPTLGGTAGGDLSGTYPNPTIAANAITTAKIANDAVTNAKLATDPASLNPVSGGLLNVVSSGGFTGIGVGTSTFNTQYPFVIKGNSLQNVLRFHNNADAARWHFTLTPSGISNGLNFVESGVSENRLFLEPGGNVGIGTGNPAAKLDVAGTARVTGFQLPTGAGTGRILTSDAGGSGTWQPLSIAGLTAGGDLTGTYPSPTIAANAITTAKIANDAVTNAKLATDPASLNPVSGGLLNVVSSGGFTGIGVGTSTFNTQHPFVIKGNSVQNVLRFHNNADAARWHFTLTPSGISNGLNFVESGVSENRLFLEPGGNVGIGTGNPAYKLDVAGTVHCTDLNTSSDFRFKNDIRPLDSALETLLSLKGVSYEWDRKAWPNRGFGEGRQLGFIAQEVQKVLPMLVRTDAEGYLSVNYQGVIPVLVEALKAQQKEIDALKKQNERLAALEAQVKENAELKVQLNAVLERLSRLEHDHR